MLFVLVALLVATVLPTTPAAAVEVRSLGTARVLGDITHQRIEVRYSSGAVARGDVLRFREDDPGVQLRPRLARGSVAGLQQLVPMAQGQLANGAVAGINGGYWLPRPTGAPNGLHVTNGRLVAGQAVNSINGNGLPTGRGMLGIQQDGRMVMDRILVDLTLDRPQLDGLTATIDELNRQVWPPSEARRRPFGELLLYDHRFGATIAVPSGATVVVVTGMTVRSSGRTEGRIAAVYQPPEDTSFTVPRDSHVLVGYGVQGEALGDVLPGETIGVTTTITPEATAAGAWEQLRGGAAGGQLLIRDGVRRPVDEWTTLAAFSDAHALARQPRTAIARRADGTGMLVTIDGRRSGWSVGATVNELTRILLELGAVDAVNLDGGGSTTMVVDGRIRNRPSESGRSVADGLFLYVQPPAAARSLAEACTGEVILASTVFVDVPGTTHADSVFCLASWGVTTGVTPTTFAPGAAITRAQMASFLARWIDDHAARGEGTALPDTDTRPFADVSAGNVHAGAIARLAAADIVTGRSSTVFDPLAPVTRAQTASMLTRALEHVTGRAIPAGRDTFVDDNGSAHEGNIDRLAATGIVTGVGGFSFQPSAPVTRGAMASVLMRATAQLVADGVALPPDGAVPAGSAGDDEVEQDATATEPTTSTSEPATSSTPTTSTSDPDPASTTQQTTTTDG